MEPETEVYGDSGAGRALSGGPLSGGPNSQCGLDGPLGAGGRGHACADGLVQRADSGEISLGGFGEKHGVFLLFCVGGNNPSVCFADTSPVKGRLGNLGSPS